MWRKIVREIKYHHLVPALAILSVIFITMGGIVYLEVPAGIRGRGFYLLLILLIAVLLWGILLILATHVAHRDGFLNGYRDGFTDGEKSEPKKSS